MPYCVFLRMTDDGAVLAGSKKEKKMTFKGTVSDSGERLLICELNKQTNAHISLALSQKLRPPNIMDMHC